MNIRSVSLPMEALAHYLQAQGLSGDGPLNASPLTGGQSNPTFRLSTGARHYVLRKKPPGQLIASAHAIDREYRVMKALRGTDVPVPHMYLYCEDESIVGTPFYLMEFLDGRVLVDQSLPGMAPAERGTIYREMSRVIAALHSVDQEAVGLASYGKPGNYFARQITRWSRQCRESTLPVNDAMQKLMDWLPDNIPQGDETTLVHGDYRLDNLVFHPTESRVIGVLDWELSTLGHPLADLSYQCMSWRISPTLWRGIAGLDLAALGIPKEEEYVAMYTEATGRDPAEHWDFYLAYNLFRMAAILHGIAQRAADGNAAAHDAVETGRKAAPLAELGWESAQRYEASRR
ncbi:phosphotransferase [Glaciimonas immobilis]|uniref:Acyl-CoA dehydrogenase n=1 Tax=Glaciimonas immobilis TaxID=728004 RepID=A0A840RX87_9BURK|nr:phosphotransferase [Glaciimonas immobilis]KAF3996055.1 phosphotransferase [Glaciimonas immobilis]MBB5201812.1 acyl-CoA dehydrogenase [Glaciimonas immobilis]